MMEKKKETTAKILSFERDAEYYFQRFQKSIDQGKYMDSLISLRTALRKDPANDEYMVSLAELYTGMEFYEESNFILFDLLMRGVHFDGDVLFGMACNFFGLRDYDKTEECLNKYLLKYPDGDFVYDAEDMLSLLEESELEEDVMPQEAVKLAEEGKRRLDTGDYRGAIQIMQRLADEYPTLTFIKNNLALAYFCLGQRKKAIDLSRQVLKRENNNLHAICNLALFYHAGRETQASQQYIDKMQFVKPTDLEETLKLLLTYCELGVHEKAYSMSKELYSSKRYDARVLFLCAASAANTGRLDEAIEHFMDILRMNPDDTVALYFKNAVQAAKRKGATVKVNYYYQVPLEEIKNRLVYLNECASLPVEELLLLWKAEDGGLRKLLNWALRFSDTNIKHLAIELLYRLGDDQAVKVLKRFLLRESEPDELKNDIFVMLNNLSVKQPFVAYVGGKIAEVRVGSLDGKKGLSKGHQAVLEVLINSSFVQSNRELLTSCVEIFNRYLSAFDKAPAIRNKNAWAAALLYVGMLRKQPDLSFSLKHICDELNASINSVRRCIKLINKTI